MHSLPTLSGPEFLDAVADAEAANDNAINADVYRARAAEWAQTERRLREAEADRDRLADQLDTVRRAAQAAA